MGRQDCAGVWGGPQSEDHCGDCDADSTNDCDQDCAGVWGGSFVLDECGACDADISNDCNLDCAGVWGGSAAHDECFVCDPDPANNCAQVTYLPLNATWHVCVVVEQTFLGTVFSTFEYGYLATMRFALDCSAFQTRY